MQDCSPCSFLVVNIAKIRNLRYYSISSHQHSVVISNDKNATGTKEQRAALHDSEGRPCHPRTCATYTLYIWYVSFFLSLWNKDRRILLLINKMHSFLLKTANNKLQAGESY